MALFNVLKENGEGKKRDLDFPYTIQQYGIQLQDYDDLLEEALMDAAVIGDGSSLTNLSNTNTMATVRKVWCSTVTRAQSRVNTDAETNIAHGVEVNKTSLKFLGLPPRWKISKQKYGHTQSYTTQKSAVTRVESHKNADVETDTAGGVEGNKTATQFWHLPPELKNLKQKRSHEQLNEKQKICSRKQIKKSDMQWEKFMTKEVGTRLVITKTPVTQSVHNKRTCLPNTVTALLPSEEKEIVHPAMVTDMPVEGDTSIFHIANKLSDPGHSFERVSGKYNRKERGRLITCWKRSIESWFVSIRLTDLKGNILSHFVTWNGKDIIDHPNSSKMNDTTDRTNTEKNRLAFAKLFPTIFLLW